MRSKIYNAVYKFENMIDSLPKNNNSYGRVTLKYIFLNLYILKQKYL
jgi:hypothetical protein